MKLSKIILLSFFCLCFVISLFYTFKILGAQPDARLEGDYEVREFNREISTIIVEGGWSITAFVGPNAHLKSGRFLEFDLEADSLEKQRLVKTGGNGLMLNRYIDEFDESLLERIVVRGDSLIFRRLKPSQSVLLAGMGRLRINLAKLQNVTMNGHSQMSLYGASSEGPVRLETMNVNLTDEAYISMGKLEFGLLNLDAKGRAQINLRLRRGNNMFNTEGNKFIVIYEPEEKLEMESNIELSGNSKMTIDVGNSQLDDFKLHDEAHVVLLPGTGSAAILTKDGMKYDKSRMELVER